MKTLRKELDVANRAVANADNQFPKKVAGMLSGEDRKVFMQSYKGKGGVRPRTRRDLLRCFMGRRESN